jgi:hypothetical protein
MPSRSAKSRSTGRRSCSTGPGYDGHHPLQRARLAEYLDAIVLPIANVQQVIDGAEHAMWMAAIACTEQRGVILYRIVDRAGDAAPLPQILSRRTEYHDPMIAVAVGDVDASRVARSPDRAPDRPTCPRVD